MSLLVERTVKIPDLPIGTGSALGACIRALYLTATRKLCIVGVKINLQDNKARNFNIFDPLDDASSALVSDLILHLTTEPYHISSSMISSFVDIAAQTLSDTVSNDNEPMTGLYSMTVNWEPSATQTANKTIISKNQFSSVFTDVADYQGYKFPAEMVVLSPMAKPLAITLYISNCRGNFTQADSSAFLSDFNVANNVIPVAGCGQRTSKCWFTISNTDSVNLETLELHLKGEAVCIEDDMQQLQSVFNHYMQMCKTSIGNLR